MKKEPILIINTELPSKVSFNQVSGWHWRRKNQLKNEFSEYLYYTLKPYQPYPKFKYPLRIEYFFKLKGKLLDCTNCAFMAKLIEDILVKQGAFTDDTPEYIYPSGPFYSDKGDKNEVTIKIYE